MQLSDEIEQVRKDIKSGKFVNEAQVSRGIVMRLLAALGWPVYDMSIVVPEYPLEQRRVDYALCHPPNKPTAVVEVKAIGKLESGEIQLFEYAFIAGIQLAVLTDGQEWHFYLPSGKGHISERRFYKLDLIEREIDETVSRLTKYLAFDRMSSGDALKSAQQDHDSQSITRDITRALPIAWKKLLEEQDSILLELLAEKVADICGYKPSLDVVGKFIETTSSGSQSNQPAVPPSPKSTFAKPPAVPRTTSFNSEIGFTFRGSRKNFSSAIDVLHSVLETFAGLDSAFLQKFISRKHGHRRRYVAPNKSELYPGRPDLADHSRQLSNGWWMGTNYGKMNQYKIIELACDVAGVSYGTELIANLGE